MGCLQQKNKKWNIIILEADKRRTYKSLENYTWHTDTYIHRLLCILVSLIFQRVYKLYSTWIKSSNCIIDPPFCSLCGVEGGTHDDDHLASGRDCQSWYAFCKTLHHQFFFFSNPLLKGIF
jgi:hypothetical protein